MLCGMKERTQIYTKQKWPLCTAASSRDSQANHAQSKIVLSNSMSASVFIIKQYPTLPRRIGAVLEGMSPPFINSHTPEDSLNVSLTDRIKNN